MSSRSALILLFGALFLPVLSGCKSVYSDTFSYRKNSFKAPAVKQIEIKGPTDMPMPLDGMAPGGVAPGNPMGIPGAPAPDAGGIPGAVPGIPGLPEAAPAIPGLN